MKATSPLTREEFAAVATSKPNGNGHVNGHSRAPASTNGAVAAPAPPRAVPEVAPDPIAAARQRVIDRLSRAMEGALLVGWRRSIESLKDRHTGEVSERAIAQAWHDAQAVAESLIGHVFDEAMKETGRTT
jgi:hypothetical protein